VPINTGHPGERKQRSEISFNVEERDKFSEKKVKNRANTGYMTVRKESDR